MTVNGTTIKRAYNVIIYADNGDGHRAEHVARRRRRYVKCRATEQQRRLLPDPMRRRTGLPDWFLWRARRGAEVLRVTRYFFFFKIIEDPSDRHRAARRGPVSATAAALVTRQRNEWYPGTGRRVRLATVCSRDHVQWQPCNVRVSTDLFVVIRLICIGGS
jgi:hypothetical protein